MRLDFSLKQWRWEFLRGRVLIVAIFCLWFLPQNGFAFDPVTENLLRLRFLLPGNNAGGLSVDHLDWKSLPPSVDMRGEMEDLQVNFIQQGNRNSCAAFSATSVLEFQQRRLGNDIDISEQYTLWAAQKAGANPRMGLTIQELAMGFSLYKVCREEVMPYKSSDVISEPTDLAIEDAKRMPEIVMDQVVETRGRVGQTPEEIFRICKTLAKSQPVCLASEWGESEGSLNPSNELKEGPMTGFHMVILTGYELSPANPMEGHFILRNSWGMSWGDFGYAKMPFSYARKHAIEAVTYRFKANEKANLVMDQTKEAGVAGKTADGLGSYLVQMTLIGLLSVCLAIYLSCWIVGKKVRSVRSTLFYLPGSTLYFVALALMSGVLLRRLETGSLVWVAPLAVAFLSLLFRWICVTGTRFQMTRGRAAAFVLVAMLLWNLFGWAGNTFMPMESFRTWRIALQSVSPVTAFKLAGGTTQQREAFLKISQTKPDTESNSAETLEKKWLMGWSEELRQEQSLMRGGQPVALGYHRKRVASYEKLRRAYLAKSPPSSSPALAATSATPDATKAEREKELWKRFNDLTKEKNALDPNNASAVMQYNQKAAAYQALKSGGEKVVAAAPENPVSSKQN